jgi:hypothetical protein
MCLFGFNNEKPFFTSCHPFWTQHGWKAIDPEGAKTENDPLLSQDSLNEQHIH